MTDTVAENTRHMLRIPAPLTQGLFYLLGSQLGLLFARLDGGVTPICFAAGIALAGTLVHGPKILPGILAGAILSLLLYGNSWDLAIGMGLASVLEAYIAYRLIRHYSAPAKLFAKPAHTGLFLLLAVLLAPLTGALTGNLILWLSGIVTPDTLSISILTWWVGDAGGILLLTPLLMVWSNSEKRSRPEHPVESLLLILMTLLVSAVIFADLAPLVTGHYPISFLPLPILAWCAFRFHVRITTGIVTLIGILALYGTHSGVGPFAQSENSNLALVLLQLYIGTLAGTTLIMKAFLDDRQISRNHLKLAATVIEHTPDAIVVTAPNGRILAANPAFFSNTGYSRQELLGKPIKILHSGHHDESFYQTMWRTIEKHGQWKGEIWNRNKNGEILPEWLNIIAIHDKQQRISHYIGIYSDVARQKQVMDRINKLAYYDMLTSLPNRQLFNDRLAQTIKYASRNNKRLGLLFLDLDRFKNINDTLGHGAGDKVLAQAGERLGRCVRQTDTLARLGGDEFTIILQDINDEFDAILVAEKILHVFKRPLSLDQHELFLTPSIGISLFPENGDTPDELIKYADTAMYRAKELGGNNYQVFSSGMSEPFQWNLEVETALRRTISNSTIQMLYQPQFDLQMGAVIGVEALARWNDPELGNVTPDTFIRVAENTGLIHQLGEQALENACQQAIRWSKQGINGLRISVNVSTLQLKQRDFIDRVKLITNHCRECGNMLELEITESSLMENAEFMEEALSRLSSLGLQIAVDDFGTGYSSLSYLKRLTIDRLKIDQSFVNDLPGNHNDAAICKAIIAMAHSLNLRVVAEGVETDEQMEFLRRENCDEMQGYLFSRPIQADEITEMINQKYWHISAENRH